MSTEFARLEAYIKEKGSFTAPMLQREFGLGFKEANDFIDSMVKQESVAYVGGLEYLYSREEPKEKPPRERFVFDAAEEYPDLDEFDDSGELNLPDEEEFDELEDEPEPFFPKDRCEIPVPFFDFSRRKSKKNRKEREKADLEILYYCVLNEGATRDSVAARFRLGKEEAEEGIKRLCEKKYITVVGDVENPRCIPMLDEVDMQDLYRAVNGKKAELDCNKLRGKRNLKKLKKIFEPNFTVSVEDEIYIYDSRREYYAGRKIRFRVADFVDGEIVLGDCYEIYDRILKSVNGRRAKADYEYFSVIRQYPVTTKRQETQVVIRDKREAEEKFRYLYRAMTGVINFYDDNQ